MGTVPLARLAPLESKSGRTHSGVETQRRRHQKSKTGVPVASNTDMCPPKKNKQIKWGIHFDKTLPTHFILLDRHAASTLVISLYLLIYLDHILPRSYDSNDYNCGTHRRKSNRARYPRDFRIAPSSRILVRNLTDLSKSSPHLVRNPIQINAF